MLRLPRIRDLVRAGTCARTARGLALLILAIVVSPHARAQSAARSCPAATTLRGAAAPGADGDSMPAEARVEIDSARSEVRVIAGPYHIAAGAAAHSHSKSMDATVLRFVWPAHGWLRGYRIMLCDADALTSAQLPREMIHHAGLANFSRRQLVYPMVERLLAVGKETDDVLLPAGVGVPLERGDTLGVYAGLHGSTGVAVERAYLVVTLPWLSARTQAPIEVLPFYADVNNVIGGTTAFDLNPGVVVRSAEFVMPISGRLLGIGGHMHDYGVALRLEDAENGKVLARLRADRRADGRINGVSRFNFGFHEEALHLNAGHRYRIVAEYDNPTKSSVPHGGMGSIAGAFAPDDLSKWPSLNRADSSVVRDEASLAMGDMSMP